MVFSARGRGGIFLLLSEDADEMPFQVLICFSNKSDLHNYVTHSLIFLRIETYLIGVFGFSL
jgi:hypothetical protein